MNIRSKRNILNFDEAGFRAGCSKKQEVLVPLDVDEYYAVRPENRKSITIIELINAAGDFPTPPMIIIQDQDLMASWFTEDLPDGTHILPSDSVFTSDKIALEY